MKHERLYSDAEVAMLELIWDPGFLSPGGKGHVAIMIDGLDVKNKSILDLGCGLGGPAFVLAETHGASVVGIDIDPHLIDQAQSRAKELSLDTKTDFQLIEPGPFTFPNDSFDVVLDSGVIEFIEDKREVFKECLRVLKPGGVLTCEDWMKPEGEYSEEMHCWFELEALPYALETPECHKKILQELGFIEIKFKNRSDQFLSEMRDEYSKLQFELHPSLVKILGPELADRCVENWRVALLVCEKGELFSTYFRARKPT